MGVSAKLYSFSYDSLEVFYGLFFMAPLFFLKKRGGHIIAIKRKEKKKPIIHIKVKGQPQILLKGWPHILKNGYAP